VADVEPQPPHLGAHGGLPIPAGYRVTGRELAAPRPDLQADRLRRADLSGRVVGAPLEPRHVLGITGRFKLRSPERAAFGKAVFRPGAGLDGPVLETAVLPSLRTARLVLRELARRDLDGYHAMVGGSRQIAEQRLERFLLRQQAGEIMSWAVTQAAEDTLLGVVGLCRFDKANLRAEVAYELRPEYRGQGFATEAVGRLAAHAFEDLELHRLEGHVDPANLASMRVLEKNGFTREGHLRENHRADGAWHDTVIYGRLRA
jgi:[ribosomal protein S5]-alanine N-acetyltransferase